MKLLWSYGTAAYAISGHLGLYLCLRLQSWAKRRISIGYASEEDWALYDRLPRMIFAASVRWNASQNMYSFLFWHGVCNGRHVIWPLFLPTPQQPAFVTLNPEHHMHKSPISNTKFENYLKKIVSSLYLTFSKPFDRHTKKYVPCDTFLDNFIRTSDKWGIQ